MDTYRAGTARLTVPLGLDGFVDVVEAGSIAAAARKQGETRSTLSRRLSRLEADLGVELVSRTTRRLIPTRAGEELYRRAKHILAELRAAEEALRRLDDVARGPLRVSIPPGGAADLLGRMFSAFLVAYPEVAVEIVSSDRHVDLVREGFDAAVRAGEGSDPGLVRVVVSRVRTGVVASPEYLAAHGTPTRVEDLRNHRCIVGFGGTERVLGHWPLLAGGSQRVVAAIACSDLGIQRVLAREGRGIALLPEVIVRPDLAAAALVPVLTELIGAVTTFSIVYPERRILEPQVRAFVEFAATYLRTNAP